MFYLIATLLVGISFAPFIFSGLDIWHAQGFWVQSGILVLFSWSFFEKSRTCYIRNQALGALHFWVAALTAYICYQSQLQGQYNIQNFFPYFNFLCLVVFYQVIVKYLCKRKIDRILSVLRYVVIVTIFMSFLQYINVAQFFTLLSDHNYYNNLVSGFIGNGTHLSGFLASCTPLFLMKRKRENVLCLAALVMILTQAGTTASDPSVSGFFIFFVLTGFYLFKKDRKLLWTLGSLFVLSIVAFFSFAEEKVFDKIMNPNGRIDLWKYYWRVFSTEIKTPVTGVGIGRINQVYKFTAFPSARHLHMEYFHFMFETGIIGALLILNLVRDFFTREHKSNTQLILKLMVMGFCLSCCFNYPAHLWLPATWCMFAYASYMALENGKEKENDKQP